jgi:hypothetical protein
MGSSVGSSYPVVSPVLTNASFSANETYWGVQWILDHYASQAKANKPTILEEFGYVRPFSVFCIHVTYIFIVSCSVTVNQTM